MLNFAALTILIHLNCNAYERAKSKKSCKIVQKVCKCRIFYVLLPMSSRRERAKAQNRQQLTPKTTTVQISKEKNDFLFELGKYCYDLSKLTFAGVVLVDAFHLSMENTLDLVSGSIVMISLLILGMILVKRGTKKE